jgi:predicted transcriptional regulator
MTRNPVTIAEKDTLQRAINLMSNNSIKRLLVTDEQRQVKGIVARADLMKLFTGR